MKQILTFLLLLFTVSSFSQEIEVITQEKTQGYITLLSYSPDGSLLASGSAKENSIKIWDINSGKIIGKLDGHTDYTTAIMFNDDGTKIVSTANDQYLITWDIINWEMVDSVKTESPVLNMCLNPNQKGTFYTGSDDGEVNEWAISNIQEHKTLYKEDNAITKLACSGKHLASGGKNGQITVYNLESNATEKSKKVHTSKVIGLNFYNDGQGLITTGGGGLVHLWNINDLQDSKHIKASNSGITAFDANVEKNRFVTASSTRRIRVWDLEGNEIYEFKDKLEDQNNTEAVRALQISPDGSTVASSGFGKTRSFKLRKGDNVIRIWDMNRGSLYKLLEGQVNPIYTFDFHPNENKLVTLGEDRILTFWDFNLAEKYGEFELQEPHREIPPKMKFWSKDNISKKTDGILGSIKNGRIPTIGVRKDPVQTTQKVGAKMIKRSFTEKAIVKFSSNGSYLITKLPKDDIRYYDLSKKKPEYIGPLWSYQTNINQMITSPDEKYLAVLGSGDSACSIIDMQTGEFMRKLITPGPEGRINFLFEANSLAFSPDGKLLALCFNTSQTYVFETERWNMVFANDLPGHLGLPKGAFVNFTEDGEYMIVSSSFGVKKYSTKTFDVMTADKLAIDGLSEPLDKPSNYAVTHNEGYLYIENVYDKSYQKVLKTEQRAVTHISISPKGKFGITTKSGQFLLIDPSSGEKEMLLVADGDNYIFKTSDNYYKVSKEGFELVTFRIGNQAYPFEQFDAVFNRPDLVLKKLGCQEEELMALYKLAYEKRIKKLGLKPTNTVSLDDIPNLSINNVSDIPAITVRNEVSLKVDMSDKRGLMSYNIYINNVPLYGKNGKSLSGVTTVQHTEEVSLVHGVNKIQVSCRNTNGYESLMQTVYVEKEGDAPQKDLYLITVGTSKYKDDRYNLQYAAKDGQDLATLLQSNSNGVYANVKTKALYNEDVTATNITELHHFLMSSKPDDIIMVFVAGHGVLDGNFDYYFGTYDMNFTDPANKGLSYERLEGILDGIKANKKILIMDTCHSGEVDKDDVFFAVKSDEEDDKDDGEEISFRNVGPAVEETSAATPSRLASVLFNDLRRGTGSTVISSAGGAEFAMESDEWKNGLFTYCLLDGLKSGEADLDKDGNVMLMELQEYVVDRVTKLSKGKQVPNTRIKNLELDFRIW
ncbi:caspase family protein [Paracrocinitomix mangrovi]|uniref:WD40 domain-containing protein n=1 Tax=Paracrocinitomix mangrovi TaxID=2862509 RepID=UPI001C8EE5A8|nr:caspase family protein [Paracrocinitomix mangrovi]UKN03644.1 caspase family protein [Paracrocinitomix mangrovi]